MIGFGSQSWASRRSGASGSGRPSERRHELSIANAHSTAGSWHALSGQDGAGKRRLGKLLAGLGTPDAGEVGLDGQPVGFQIPRGAPRAGGGIVHQELAFCQNLSVAENLCLDTLPGRGPFVSRAEMARRSRPQLEAVNADLHLDAEKPVHSSVTLEIGARRSSSGWAACERLVRASAYSEGELQWRAVSVRLATGRRRRCWICRNLYEAVGSSEPLVDVWSENLCPR